MITGRGASPTEMCSPGFLISEPGPSLGLEEGRKQDSEICAANPGCKFVIIYEYSATLLSYLWHLSQAGKCIHGAVLLA